MDLFSVARSGLCQVVDSVRVCLADHLPSRFQQEHIQAYDIAVDEAIMATSARAVGQKPKCEK